MWTTADFPPPPHHFPTLATHTSFFLKGIHSGVQRGYTIILPTILWGRLDWEIRNVIQSTQWGLLGWMGGFESESLTPSRMLEKSYRILTQEEWADFTLWILLTNRWEWNSKKPRRVQSRVIGWLGENDVASCWWPGPIYSDVQKSDFHIMNIDICCLPMRGDLRLPAIPMIKAFWLSHFHDSRCLKMELFPLHLFCYDMRSIFKAQDQQLIQKLATLRKSVFSLGQAFKVHAGRSRG